MTAPGSLKVLTPGAAEEAWPIWVVRGVIQGAKGPWMTPYSTRAPYSLRLTEGVRASVPLSCAPVTAKYSFRCNAGMYMAWLMHPQTDN